MTATRALRVALLGAGQIGREWIAAVQQCDGIELAGIVEQAESARSAAAALVTVPACPTVRELLGHAAFDAAIVATPPAAHEALTVDLLAKGIHVLCEKPLALNPTAAARMLHAATRVGVILMVATKFRFVPDAIEAQRLIASGAIGVPVFADLAFCSRVDMRRRWNAEPTVSGGGVLIDNGGHAFDLVRFLLGPVTRVFAHFGRRVQPIAVEDSVRVLAETQSACVAAIDLSWSAAKMTEHWLAVQGTLGTLQLGWRGSRWRKHEDSDWQNFGAAYDKRAALTSQLTNFADAIRGDAEPAVKPEDAMAAVRAVDAAYRSARLSRWIPVGYG